MVAEKTEKDIILFDDSNSYSFCYFYSGVFDKKELESKLLELYTKKFGEDAKFSYKITQKTEGVTWFASVGCKGKDIAPNKINIPAAYFAAAIISKKYKDEYIYVVVEESLSLMVFLCHNEPICSAKISNKLMAISSGIGKDITKMSEIFGKANKESVKVEKLIFYGSFSQEQINLIDSPGIKERIKEDKIDYYLFNSSLDLSLPEKSIGIEVKKEEISGQAGEEVNEPHYEKQENVVNSSLERVMGEIPPKAEEKVFKREVRGNIGGKKFLTIILSALVLGVSAFPIVGLFVKGINFYSEKINLNVEMLKSSLITEIPGDLKKEITDKTIVLSSSKELLNYSTDIFKNVVDKVIFDNPKIKITSFTIEEGVYIIKIEVNSEKDLIDYLAGIMFSNKFILNGAPKEILVGKSYELRVILFPVS